MSGAGAGNMDKGGALVGAKNKIISAGQHCLKG